ncbi:MAG: glycosyltransferase family 4 protein [Pirellulaceae bacterium]|nr:glycosyltransferase family 4 protein [Pirellulaceae bacterium]
MSKVAYVVKRYPRFSETFIVNELLAHEKAGLDIEIFSLRPPVDTHFQDLLSLVRAPLTYLSSGSVKAHELWGMMQTAHRQFPSILNSLGSVIDEDSLDIYCGLKLAVLSLQRGITHLHAHFASSAASVARIASILSGIPYSITAHAKDIFHESVVHADLENKLAEASVTFTVSEFNLQYFQQEFPPQAASKVVRLYNGLHLDQFQYVSPRQRKPQIIAVGRFVEKKGFSDLVDACTLLRSRQVPFTCCIVGSGELLPELESQIKRLNLEQHVQLLGPQPQKVVKQLIVESAVMAAPCINGSDGNRDGLPTVLLEAMALGTPCVSTDVTGIPEVIVHGQTGLLVGQHNPSALADALVRLLADGEQRAALASAARELIVNKFDIIANAASQRRYFTLNHTHSMWSESSPAQLAEV